MYLIGQKKELLSRMSKFEKKFGKYAIPNLSLVLIVCYIVGYVVRMIGPGLLDYFTLNPYMILRGQVWRLVTWIIVPRDSFDMFTIIMLFFYYSIGTALERTWGTYRYNVYLFSGMLFTIIGSFVCMAYCYLITGGMEGYDVVRLFEENATFFSTYYVNMSIFLAFAATFPDAQVLLMFIVPVKVKWMGVLYGIMMVADFITYPYIFNRFAIVFSLLNFVVFYFTSRGRIHMSPKQMKRRAQFHSEVKRNQAITRHKCAICGQTEEDNPDLQFRFCSKCNGNYEYCQEHLFTHEHVK